MWHNTAIAVLAHAGASESVREFLHQWEACHCPVIGCYPQGEQFGSPFKVTLAVGESARTGNKVFARWLDTLDALLTQPFGRFIIVEYDCVPIRPMLPKWRDGKLTATLERDYNSFGIEGNFQMAAYCPWILDRNTARILINANRPFLEQDGDGPEVGGLLDRWIVAAALRAKVPLECFLDCCPFAPHKSIDEIEANGWNWIHGFKRKAEFGRLWR